VQEGGHLLHNLLALRALSGRRCSHDHDLEGSCRHSLGIEGITTLSSPRDLASYENPCRKRGSNKPFLLQQTELQMGRCASRQREPPLALRLVVPADGWCVAAASHDGEVHASAAAMATTAARHLQPKRASLPGASETTHMAPTRLQCGELRATSSPGAARAVHLLGCFVTHGCTRCVRSGARAAPAPRQQTCVPPTPPCAFGDGK